MRTGAGVRAFRTIFSFQDWTYRENGCIFTVQRCRRRSLCESKEESPDSAGQGVLHKTRMSWTIFHEKESAAENKPPEQSGKGEKAG